MQVFDEKVANVSLAFELMMDGGLPQPKARPEDIVNLDLKSTLRSVFFHTCGRVALNKCNYNLMVCFFEERVDTSTYYRALHFLNQYLFVYITI